MKMKEWKEWKLYTIAATSNDNGFPRFGYTTRDLSPISSYGGAPDTDACTRIRFEHLFLGKQIFTRHALIAYPAPYTFPPLREHRSDFGCNGFRPRL